MAYANNQDIDNDFLMEILCHRISGSGQFNIGEGHINNINARDEHSRSCLHIALLKLRSYHDFVEKLKEEVFSRPSKQNKILGWPSLLGLEKMLWESTASSTHVHFKGHKPVVVPDVSIDKKLVEQLMDAGADVNAVDCGGNSCLHYAVENAGSCDLITMLLKSGADLELPNDYGDTALLTAVKLDNLEAVEVLVRWGADINATNYHGETSLHLARDDRLLYFLLDNSCDNETINCINECGCSPCLAAVQYCEVETLVRMIQAGADIHFKNEVRGWYSCLNYGRTPLSIAVAKNRVDIVEALLRNGANPKETWSVTDDNDEIHIKSTLKLASSFRTSFALNRMLVSDEDEKSANILQLLINHGANICDDIRSFHAVMRYGNLRAIQFCLNEFHHKRVPISTSTPLLHLALENKRDDVFKFFLQSNFDDLEKVDAKGYTALHVAVFESRIDRVGLLLSYGASVEAVDNKGYTLIDTATNYKDVESAILLLNYGYLPHRRIDMTNLNTKPFCRLLQFSLYETEMKLIVKHTTLIESLAYHSAPDILSWRSNLKQILYQNFVPALFPIIQDPFSVPPPSDHSTKKFPSLLVRQSLTLRPFFPQTKELPYDYYCLAVQDDIDGRTCPECGIYFGLKVSASLHKNSIVNNDKEVTAKKTIRNKVRRGMVAILLISCNAERMKLWY
ncbi:hypothetical protein QAD02_016131 [Eretmocerus hayati]|uniref:Uncharacterized protein n=1 Tax=Eretmocerus hayati TaxID=131215 RepID=A0ACC2PCM7_9HYME|nr:hypothetical protein QAD02_016131 [Eretmocerus hayati]